MFDMYDEEPASSDPSNILSTITEGGTISLETEQTFCDEPSEKNHRDIWNDIMKDHSEAQKNILDFIESKKARNFERFGGMTVKKLLRIIYRIRPASLTSVPVLRHKLQLRIFGSVFRLDSSEA